MVLVIKPFSNNTMYNSSYSNSSITFSNYILMKLIRKLGTRKNKKGVPQSWGEFWCDFCSQLIEKDLGSGKKCKSCGCNKNKIHGESKTKLYNVWKAMKQRCSNPNYKQYKDYGGRGITICPEWTNDYTKFKDWALNNGYTKGLQINRIENDGNYEPSNCEWITPAKNAQNRNNNTVTMQLANEIRDLYATGNYTHRQLAKKYNIWGISDIINNKSWINKGG